MVTQCIGSKKHKGCGKKGKKMSKCYKSLCCDCENELKRVQYYEQTHTKPSEMILNFEIRKAWR